MAGERRAQDSEAPSLGRGAATTSTLTAPRASSSAPDSTLHRDPHDPFTLASPDAPANEARPPHRPTMAARRSHGSASPLDEPREPPLKKRYSVPRSTACDLCRLARARCSRERPLCQRCRRQSRSCTYEADTDLGSEGTAGARPGHRGLWQVSGSDGQPQSEGDGGISSASPRSPPLLYSDPRRLNDRLASKHELRQLLSTYFTHVYHSQAMAFIHRANMFRHVEDGRASPLLIKSICAVSARFLPNADRTHVEGGRLPGIWIHEAKAGLIADTERFSTSKLAAVLCVLQHEFNCGRTASAWIFVAIAVRMALAMGLNVEYQGTEIPWIEKETRRRLMWSTYCADCFCSSGWPEYSLLSADDIRVLLPCSENNYALAVETRNVTLNELETVDKHTERDSPSNDNLLTRWIWLMKLRANLLRYTRRINDHPVRPWEADSPFEDIVKRLRHWKETLPASLQYSVDNLYARHGTEELDAFVTMHLCFDVVHSTLYRTTLPNFTESARPELLVLAPREWIQRVRYAAYVRARAVREKIGLLEVTFADHTPTARLLNLYIFSSMRVQLQYCALAAVDGVPDPSNHADTAAGFGVMIGVVGKMTRYFSENWSVVSNASIQHCQTPLRPHGTVPQLQAMLQILDRHGYDVPTEWEGRLRSDQRVLEMLHTRRGPTSGTLTPNRLLAGKLSGFPTLPAGHFGAGTYQHRRLVEPVDEHNRAGSPCADVFDPVSSSFNPLSPRPGRISPPEDLLPFSGPPRDSRTQPIDFTYDTSRRADPDPTGNHFTPGDYLSTFLPGSTDPPTASAPFSGPWDLFAESPGPGLASGMHGMHDMPLIQPFTDLPAGTWTAGGDFDWEAILEQQQQ